MEQNTNNHSEGKRRIQNIPNEFGDTNVIVT